MEKLNFRKIGFLTYQFVGVKSPLIILKSRAGYFIGTALEDGFSRESNEYFPTEDVANQALSSGIWTQKPEP